MARVVNSVGGTGPDPEALRCLSYAECKVINLARIYVSVKRVFLDRTSYVKMLNYGRCGASFGLRCGFVR